MRGTIRLLLSPRCSGFSYLPISLTPFSHISLFKIIIMPLPSSFRVTLPKPIYFAVFLLLVLLYIFPRHNTSQSISTLQAFTPSGSHYNAEYRHDSSHEPAVPPPSANFIDLSKLNSTSLSYAHYNPYFEANSLWHGSRKPCVGPRGVDVSGNPDDMLVAYAVKSPGKLRFPWTLSNH